MVYFPKNLTSASTTDAVTARDFTQLTPRRARHVDFEAVE